MFAGLKRAARAIFVDDVRLRRDEQGLRIVLESGPVTVEAPAQRQQRLADERRAQQLALIRRQLSDVFDTVPGLRQHLVSLARVEQALADEGLAFLDTMPLPLMKAGLRQFEDAVVNWSPEGLAYLRSRMAVALRERGRRESVDGDSTGTASSRVAGSNGSSASMEDRLRDSSALPLAREIDTGSGDLGGEDEAALLAAYGAAAAAADPGHTAGRN